MATISAISSDNITALGIGLIVAVVVVGALLTMVISALLGRILILVVALVLGILIWQQRDHVKDQFTTQKCNLSATFFGVHVDAPASVQQACRTHA